jgi:hypothetical protein
LLCKALDASVRRYLFSFLYEGMMSCDAREDFLRGGGFCAPHFWEAKVIEEMCWPDGFGISILCENLLVRGIEDLGKWIGRPSPAKAGLWSFLRESREAQSGSRPVVDCIACRLVRETEEHYLGALEQLLGDAAFAEAYRLSSGLCLRHLVVAENLWGSPEARSLAKATAQSYVEGMIAELREFQHLHDYQHRNEARGRESSSAERAIEFLAGPKPRNAGLAEPMPKRRSRHSARGPSGDFQAESPEPPER